MLRPRTMAICLAVTACSDRILTLELPPLSTQRSAIFAFHVPDKFEARAIDLEASEVAIILPVNLDPSAEGSIEVLAFEQSLAELDLPAGTIASAEAGDPIPRRESARFVATFRGSEAGAWSPADERSEELESFRLPYDCTEFSIADSFLLDTRADHAFTLALGPERVLIADTDGVVYVVEPSGALLVTDVALPRPLTDVLQLDDGTLLFSGLGGRIWSGRITTSTSSSPLRIEGTSFTSIPGVDRIVRIAGDARELFALSELGGFYRWDGGDWTELHQFGVEVNTASSVVRPRPGLAYAGADEKAEIVRYRDGRLGPFSPPDLVNGVPTMRYLDGYGLLASRSEGGIYRLPDEDSAWELLEGSPISLNVFAIYGLDDGFLFGGAFGFFSQYRIGVGYCPAVQLAAGAIRSITRFGDGFIFGEDKPMSRDRTQVTIVRPE